MQLRHRTKQRRTVARGGSPWTAFPPASAPFAILFYYGFTVIACAIYFRRELFASARDFLLAGVVPLAGGLIMAAVFVRTLERPVEHAPAHL